MQKAKRNRSAEDPAYPAYVLPEHRNFCGYSITSMSVRFWLDTAFPASDFIDDLMLRIRHSPPIWEWSILKIPNLPTADETRPDAASRTLCVHFWRAVRAWEAI